MRRRRRRIRRRRSRKSRWGLWGNSYLRRFGIINMGDEDERERELGFVTICGGDVPRKSFGCSFFQPPVKAMEEKLRCSRFKWTGIYDYHTTGPIEMEWMSECHVVSIKKKGYPCCENFECIFRILVSYLLLFIYLKEVNQICVFINKHIKELEWLHETMFMCLLTSECFSIVG